MSPQTQILNLLRPSLDTTESPRQYATVITASLQLSICSVSPSSRQHFSCFFAIFVSTMSSFLSRIQRSVTEDITTVALDFTSPTSRSKTVNNDPQRERRNHTAPRGPPNATLPSRVFQSRQMPVVKKSAKEMRNRQRSGSGGHVSRGGGRHSGE